MPILFSIDGTFLKDKQLKTRLKKLTKSIDNFFTKLAKYKKKKNLSYLFPRIRFEFKVYYVRTQRKPSLSILRTEKVTPRLRSIFLY